VTLNGLYNKVEEFSINYSEMSLPVARSLSGVAPSGAQYIALDTARLTNAEQKTRLAHEIGHCATGSFYNVHAVHDDIGRHEHRANRWAIERLMPQDEVQQALRDGYADVWQLAERFGVTEDFAARALRYYTERRGVQFYAAEEGKDD
jgi:Zn-dependent peptidase ImmA (M78 family)